MNTEYEIKRLKEEVSRIHAKLGQHRERLCKLECTDNLEGPPRTADELAQNARELDAVVPTPADKFQLMFQTDRFKVLLGLLDYPNPEGIDDREALWRDFARTLKQQRDNAVKAASQMAIEKRELGKERDEARSLVTAFEKTVNAGAGCEEVLTEYRAVSEVEYIFRLHRELRERIEQVIGHWRDTDWFREGPVADRDPIVVGVDEAAARKLLNCLKP